VKATHVNATRLTSVSFPFNILSGSAATPLGISCDSFLRPKDRMGPRVMSRPRVTQLLPLLLLFSSILANNLMAESPRARGVSGDVAGTTHRLRAAITGVVRDSLRNPIVGATVQIDATTISVRSDSAGRYRLTGVPMGVYTLSVRALGFVPVSNRIVVSDERDITHDVLLFQSNVRLDELVVRADAIDSRMFEFEENRSLGLGRFVARSELDAQRGQSLATIMAKVNSVGIVRGMGNRGWILSRRPIVTGSCREGQAGGALYGPSRSERSQGMVCGCYAQVYLDGQLMNPGYPAEPFDVNTFSADQLEAIEWYASASQTPARYARLNSGCGVYVMHSRR
jgi:hypothetical protein